MFKKSSETNKKGKQKFILIVGDEGGILILVDGTTMINRTFFATPSAPDFVASLEAYPDIPVYILSDVVDQAYIHNTMPPVSRINIKKLIKKKLERDFDATDLSSYIMLDKDTEGKKEWNCLFVSIRNIPPFSDWVNVVVELPNKFEGIYMAPLESVNFLSDLQKTFSSSDKKESEWQILVSHNRVGGFRQTVFKKGTVVFTRIAQPIGNQTPDVVAGNIEQETLNTLEYIRRLGYRDEPLDIFIIASKEVKEVLSVSAFPANMTQVVTPFEAAGRLNLQHAAEEKDRFGDIVSAVHFVARKVHILRLETDYIRKIKQLLQYKLFFRMGASIAALALVFLSVISFIDIFSFGEKIDEAEVKRTQAQALLAEAEKDKTSITGNPELIKDVAKLSSFLSKDFYFPLNFLTEYSGAKVENSYVKAMEIIIRKNKANDSIIDAVLDVDIGARKGESIDSILDRVSNFTNSIKTKFGNYYVMFDRLPDATGLSINLDVGNGTGPQPISLKIKGPKDKTL